MPRGGKRPGAGKPKGYKHKATLNKIEARELVRQAVIKELRPLLEAQIAHARGLKYLVVRAKGSGKFLRVTEAMAKVKLGKDEEIIEVWEKDPSVQAFTDLLNRALDKPKEQEQDINLNVRDSDQVIARLHAARARLAKRKKADG